MLNNFCYSCRFMLGGEHGKLKHGPPQGHSAVVESLMPKDRLRLEPCFMFGEASKNILSGPTEITDYVPFVPKAIDTANVNIYTCSCLNFILLIIFVLLHSLYGASIYLHLYRSSYQST